MLVNPKDVPKNSIINTKSKGAAPAGGDRLKQIREQAYNLISSGVPNDRNLAKQVFQNDGEFWNFANVLTEVEQQVRADQAAYKNKVESGMTKGMGGLVYSTPKTSLSARDQLLSRSVLQGLVGGQATGRRILTGV